MTTDHKLEYLVGVYVAASKFYREAPSMDSFTAQLSAFDKLCSHTGLNEAQMLQTLKERGVF
jgi:hypothetical protein